MKDLILIIFIVFVVLLLYKMLKKHFKFNFDRVVLITGGSGSGKTLLLTKTSINLFKKNYSLVARDNLKIKFINVFRKLAKKELLKYYDLPKLYSNYPIFIGYKYSNSGFSYRLTKDIFLQRELIADYSIIAISELNKVASQWDFKKEFIMNYFNKFVSQGRHYFNGYILADDQSSSNVVNTYTRSSGSYVYTFDFKIINLLLFKIGYHRIFKVPTSEEIQLSINDDIIEKSKISFYFFFPWCKKKYDTRFMSKFYGFPNLVMLNNDNVKPYYNSYKCDYQLNINDIEMQLKEEKEIEKRKHI